MSEFANVREAAHHEELLLHRGMVLIGGLLAGAAAGLGLSALIPCAACGSGEVAGTLSLGFLVPGLKLQAFAVLAGALVGVAAAYYLWLLVAWGQKAVTQVPLPVLLKRAAAPFAAFLPLVTVLTGNETFPLASGLVFLGLHAGFTLLAFMERKDKRKLYFAFPTENEYHPASLFTHGAVITLGTGAGWFLQSLPGGLLPAGLWPALAVGIAVWMLAQLLAGLIGILYTKLTYDQVFLAVAMACLPLALLPLQTMGWVQFVDQGKVVAEQKALWLPWTLAGLAGLAAPVVLVTAMLRLNQKSAEQNPAWEELFRALMLIIAVPFLMMAVAYRPTGAAFSGPGAGLAGKIDAFREGEGLAAAQAFLNERLPFKEILLRHGFLTDIFSNLSALNLFGGSLASARLLNTMLAPLGLVAVYLLGIFCLPWLWALVLALVIMTGRLGGIPEAQFFFPLVGFVFTLYAIQSGRWLMLLVSGVTTALAVIGSFSAGLMAVAGHGMLLLANLLLGQESMKQRLISLGVYAGTTIGCLLPWFLYLGLSGSVAAYFSNFAWVMGKYTAIFGLAPVPASQLGLGNILLVILPPLAIVLGILYFLDTLKESRENGMVHWNLLLLIPVAGLFWMRFLNRSNQEFLGQALPVAGLLTAFFVYQLTSRHRRLRGVVFLALLPALLLPQAGRHTLSQLAGDFGLKNRIDVKGLAQAATPRLANVFMPATQAQELDKVTDYLEGQVGTAETYYDFSNQPLYYFLVRRKPAVNTLSTVTAATLDQQRQVIRSLVSAEVKAVIWAGRQAAALDDIPSEIRQYAISEYLLRQFTPAFVSGDTVILTPAVAGLGPDAAAAAAMERPAQMARLPLAWGRLSKYDPTQGTAVGQMTPAASAGAGNTAAAQAASSISLTLAAPLAKPANVLVLELTAPAALDNSEVRLVWGQGRSASFALAGDGERHRYVIRVASLPAWVLAGNVDRCTLEFAGPGATCQAASFLQVLDVPEMPAAAPAAATEASAAAKGKK